MTQPLPPYLATLQSIPRWCRWRSAQNAKGRPTKVPDQSTAELAECRSHEAVAYARGPMRNGVTQRGAPLPMTADTGVGFIMTGTVPHGAGVLLAIDVDSCVADDGTIVPEVEQLLDRFASATEITPSSRGLRIWLATEPVPGELARLRVRVRGDWAPTVEGKRAELQLFGGGAAGYVTVTGQHLAGTPTEIRVVPWADLVEVFGLHDVVAAGGRGAGWGPRPTVDELRDAVLEWRHGARLLAAQWEGLDYESASEAFFALVCVLLRAGRGWRGEVVEFLLGQTYWGAGLVAESRDPSRYARRDWVVDEVERAAVKTDAARDPAAAFEALPPEGEKPAPETETPGAEPSVDPSEKGAVEGASDPIPPPPSPQPSATPPPSGLRFWSFAELLERGRPRELWQRMLPAGGLGVWYGAPKSGKTYLALALALAVAEGRPCLGRCTLQGRVLYVAGEGVLGVADKVAAALGPARVRDPADPIHANLFVLPGMPRWVDDRVVARVLSEVERAGGVDLIVIDTISRALGASGLDENSTEDMGAFVGALDALRAATRAAVLGVHHENKTGGDRGSSVLRGAADVFARVSRAGKRRSTYTVEDMRDGEPCDPIDAVWEDVQVGTDEHGPVLRWRLQAHATQSTPVDEAVTAILTVLRRASRPLSAADIAAELPAVGKTRRQEILARLWKDGIVQRTGDGAKVRWSAASGFTGSGPVDSVSQSGSEGVPG